MIQTDSALYRNLVWAAILCAVLAVGTVIYQYVLVSDAPGALNYRTGNQRLEDGLYKKALVEFDAQLEQNPLDPAGHLGRGLALMGMGEFNRALDAIDTALGMEPKFAAAFANRGIVFDRMGQHKNALRDYRKALELDEEMGDGPDWITRFMRKQPKSPPSIADRADYLEKELRKPASQRLLRVPEIDEKQRSYKFEKAL